MVLSAYSDFEESYLVSTQIVELMQEKKYSFSDFAVLYRTNAQSRLFEEAFRKRMIPYKIYGSQSFYQRKEVKDTLAYLRVIVNPKDEEALKRIINYPRRGIGDTTIDKLQQAALSARVCLWEVIGSPEVFQIDINKGTADKIKHFRLIIEEMQHFNHEMNAGEIGDLAIKMSGVHAYYLSDQTIESISRLENVNELIHAMKEFVAIRIEEGSTSISLADFLMEASLLTDQDNDKDEFTDKVTLMTVHAAKGLEFKNVFVTGLENDLFPSSQASYNPKAIEEERRLFYVAITRAKENCTMTYADNRYRNGENNQTSPSMFLNDIDKKFLNYSKTIELPANRWKSSSWSSDDEPSDYSPRRITSVKNLAWDDDGIRKSGHLRPIQQLTGKINQPVSKPVEKVSSLAGFSVGNQIFHERFGEGVITSLDGQGGNAKATVDFAHVGCKILLLKYANIKLIQK